MQAATKRTFRHMPAEECFPQALARLIMRKWGWREADWWQEWDGNTFNGSADIFWSIDASVVTQSSLPNVKLTNHIDGACYLCNKSALGWCLEGCKACADCIFPRQYGLYNAGSLQAFLDDYAAMQEAALAQQAQQAQQVQQVQRGEGSAGQQLPPSCQAMISSFVDGDRPGLTAPSWVANSAAISAGGALGGDGKYDAGAQKIHTGPANAWVVKGVQDGIQGNNGLSVNIFTELKDILGECELYKWNCVIQKYLENPLLVPFAVGGPSDRKTDFRVWALVLDRNPLTVFVHPDVYFRVGTKRYEFSTTKIPDPYAHKTNWREEENRLMLPELLERAGLGAAEKWENRTWPQILDATRAAFLGCQAMAFGPSVHGRPRRPGPPTFELFGLDFAIDSEWNPWLLEVNMSPAMLDDCKLPDLLKFAQEAAEEMISMAWSYNQGELKLPTSEELLDYDGSKADGASRTFKSASSRQEVGHGAAPWCYGDIIASLPPCLARGLCLGGTCGRWLLALRQPAASTDAIASWSKEAWVRWTGTISEGDRSHLLARRPAPPPPMPVHLHWCFCSAVDAKMQLFSELLKEKFGKRLALVETPCMGCFGYHACYITVAGETVYTTGLEMYNAVKVGGMKGKGKGWQPAEKGYVSDKPAPLELKQVLLTIAERCGIQADLSLVELSKLSDLANITRRDPGVHMNCKPCEMCTTMASCPRRQGQAVEFDSFSVDS